MVRFGIVGIGNMGSAHAMALFKKKIKHAVLTCLADIDEEKRNWADQKFKGKVKVFKDYKEMYSSELMDAVIIATPHYFHPEMASEAFKCGLHVLVEKPAGVDVKSVEIMNAEAYKSGKAFGIMFNQRTSKLFATLKYYVDIGMLGEVKRFNWIINNWYRTQAYYESSGWRATWNGEGGGVLLNQAPHNLDIWQWIMGMPDMLVSFCHEGLFHDVEVEDDATIYAEYKNGATATFITSTGEYPGTNRLEISGTMGKVVAENGKLKLFLLDEDEREICNNSQEAMPTEKVTKIELDLKDEEDGHILIMRNFTEHIEKGIPLIAPGEEGINSLRISNAAYLSSWKNAPVNLPVGEEEYAEALCRKRVLERKRKPEKARLSAKFDNGKYSKRWTVQW